MNAAGTRLVPCKLFYIGENSSLPATKTHVLTSIFAAIVCFAAYASMTAFRKAFNVAPFSGYSVAGLDYKVILIITQVMGYMLSKFYGIRFISELKKLGRGKLILLLTGISWLAWLLFALIPPPYNFWLLLFNGFPLGMLWGIVFSYVEGRRATDFIGAALAVSFIFGPGLAKSTAQYVMTSWGVNEYWMPFVTALIFFFPLLFFVYLLEKIPPPDADDVAQRTERIPMKAADRRLFVKTFLPGLILLVFVYIFVTVLREVRDGFMADMWRASGENFNAAVFAKTETVISVAILVIIASMVFIKNNAKAFALAQGIMMAGFLLSGIVTWLYLQGQVNTFYWMTLVGLGLYMTYIPYNSILFDRMLATFHYAANVGFLIYLADSFGYLASVSVLLSKTIFKLQLNWLHFYTSLVLVSSVAGVCFILFSLVYFRKKRKLMLVAGRAAPVSRPATSANTV
jgi:MFS family permease